MGIEHILKDLDASELNVGYSPLHPNGLEYLNFFGGSASPGRNLATGKPQATVFGSPIVGSMSEGIVTTAMQDFIQTAVAHVEAMTILAVSKAAMEGEHFLVSNYTTEKNNATHRLRTDASIAGQGMVTPNVVASYKNADGSNTSISATGARYPIGQFRTTAMRFDMKPVTGRVRVSDLTGGTSATSANGRPENTDPNIGQPFRIGSGYTAFSSTLRKPSILFAAIWSRELSDAELASQYAQLKDFYANVKGVAV